LLTAEVLDRPSPVLFLKLLLLVLVSVVPVDEVAAHNEFQTAEEDHDVRGLRERLSEWSYLSA
jgi:hypothetical protein